MADLDLDALEELMKVLIIFNIVFSKRKRLSRLKIEEKLREVKAEVERDLVQEIDQDHARRNHINISIAKIDTNITKKEDLIQGEAAVKVVMESQRKKTKMRKKKKKLSLIPLKSKKKL